ncbi:hypothetical protein Tco_1563872 [Tanacetum coccineum]
MENCHTSGTPLATKPKLDADLSGKPVDQTNYRSKIGSLMYLTSSRPDLVQAVHVIKQDQQKSTSRSWMSKKQDCTAMSLAEAEYVALSASCAQVENDIIELYFVRTEYRLANMFTKALPEDRFKYLVRQIGMRCLTPAELESDTFSIYSDDGNLSRANIKQALRNFRFTHIVLSALRRFGGFCKGMDKEIDDDFASIRGGHRLRNMKERIPEENSLGNGLGEGYGMLGQAGNGKLGVSVGQSKLTAKVTKKYASRCYDLFRGLIL